MEFARRIYAPKYVRLNERISLGFSTYFEPDFESQRSIQIIIVITFLSNVPCILPFFVLHRISFGLLSNSLQLS